MDSGGTLEGLWVRFIYFKIAHLHSSLRRFNNFVNVQYAFQTLHNLLFALTNVCLHTSFLNNPLFNGNKIEMMNSVDINTTSGYHQNFSKITSIEFSINTNCLSVCLFISSISPLCLYSLVFNLSAALFSSLSAAGSRLDFPSRKQVDRSHPRSKYKMCLQTQRLQCFTSCT